MGLSKVSDNDLKPPGIVSISTARENHRAPYRVFPSIRLLVFFLLFVAVTFGNACYCILNLTLVCMVNSTAEGLVDGQQNITSDDMAEHADGYRGDVVWSREQQANILASYSWGTFVLTVPGGIVLDKYGAKIVILIAQFANVITLIAFPFVVYAGEWPTFVLRFIVGMTAGIYWPAALTVASRWASKKEAGVMVALAASGFPVGAVLANVISGLFCSIDDHGWQYSYFFWGGLNAAFIGIFWYLFEDDPLKQRFISDVEAGFIIRDRTIRRVSINAIEAEIPWKSVLKSGAVWAIIVAEFVAGWVYVIITIFMPTYIKDVLRGVSPSANGIFSALPPLLQVVGRFFFGALSDKLGNRLNADLSVKIFDIMAVGLPGVLFLVITFLSTESAMLAIACFSLGQFFYAASIGGFLRSTMRIAPEFIGLIGSFGEIALCTALSVGPYVIGAITSRGTEEQWNTVMYLAAAISAVSVCVTVGLAKGNLQKWAEPKSIVRLQSIVAAMPKE